MILMGKHIKRSRLATGTCAAALALSLPVAVSGAAWANDAASTAEPERAVAFAMESGGGFFPDPN